MLAEHDERRTPPDVARRPAGEFVLSINQFAALLNESPRSARRRLMRGDGPPLVQRSPGRLGVTASAAHAYIAALPVIS